DRRRDAYAEADPTDGREEGDAAAVRRRRRKSEVALEELVEEPAAEVDPGRDFHEEDVPERPATCARVENEEGAEHRGDRPTGTERRHTCGCCRTEEQCDGG